jgi:hypothetical protein
MKPQKSWFTRQRNALLGSFGLFVVIAMMLGLVGIASVAWSDSQITPKGQNGQNTWGDPDEASKLLQSNHDPEVVRDHPPTPEERERIVRTRVASDCTDANGRSLDPASPEGKRCMAQSAQLVPAANAVAQPTSRPILGNPPNNGIGSSNGQGYSIDH